MTIPGRSRVVKDTGGPDHEGTGPSFDVSVIIASYDSRRTIGACLRSVLAQETELRYEVIVADSSDDGTEELIRSEFPQVRLIHSRERLTCGGARNVAIRESRGEILLMIDTDCEAEPDWLSRMVAAMREHGADGVCASLVNGTPWSLSGSTGYFLEFFRFLGPRGRARPSPFLLGGTSAFRRWVFERAAFPETNAGDDFEFTWSLWRDGARLFTVPSIRVVHHNRKGLRRVLRYQYELGKAAARYRRRTSPRITRLIAAFPPLAALIPPVVLLWIGSYVLRRSSPVGVCRFLVISPFLLSANYVWAFGLVHGLRTRSGAEEERAPAPPLAAGSARG
jgi:GT2 family glycosyltransferase